MKKEIGGYFELEHFAGKEFYPNLLKVNTARNALVYALKARHIKKLYIPYFLCDCIYEVCEREGYEYAFYAIDENFLPKFEKELGENEYLYVVNYYGQLSKSQIVRLQRKYKKIIVDNVQAFFQKPIKGIDTIYSCRKFFGVPDGAYLSTDSRLKEPLKEGESKDRIKHVIGRFETDCANRYYAEFKDRENDLRTLDLTRMSKLTQNILKAIKYRSVCKQRERNFKVLQKELATQNKLNVRFTKGPYAYPFYCKNGKRVREALAKEGVYIATLWPNVVSEEYPLEREYAQNVLPIPIDQRYTKEDMRVIARVLLKNLYAEERENNV